MGNKITSPFHPSKQLAPMYQESNVFYKHITDVVVFLEDGGRNVVSHHNILLNNTSNGKKTCIIFLPIPMDNSNIYHIKTFSNMLVIYINHANRMICHI